MTFHPSPSLYAVTQMFRSGRIACVTIAVMVALLCPGCDDGATTNSPARNVSIASETPAAAKITTLESRENTSARGAQKNRGSSQNDSASSAHRTRPDNRKITEPTLIVTGTVRFENGAPDTTATIELWRNGDPLQPVSSQSYRLDVSPIDANGRYTLSGRDGGSMRVELRRPVRAIADLASASDATTEPRIRRLTQDFVIPALHTIRGRVTDFNDNPVSTANVHLRSEDPLSDGWNYDNQRTTVSVSGDFIIENVPAGIATIGAEARDYPSQKGCPSTATNILVPTTGPVHLRITSGTAAIAGHVLMFPGDSPAAGVKVSVLPAGKAAAHATTEADGSFNLEQLPSGPVSIEVKAANSGIPLWSAPGEPSDALSPILTDKETTAITVRVFSGYNLTGTVLDKDTSEPLPSANVQFYSGDQASDLAVTDAAGRYSFSKIPPDASPDITVELPGYTIAANPRTSYHNGVPAYSGVDLPTDSDSLVHDMPMTAVVRVSGYIQNKEGAPVAGASLTWNGSIKFSATNYNRTTSDADGRFTFELLPFQNGMIEVTAPGYAFKRSIEYPVSSDDQTDIIIILDEGATVEGRVLNPSGDPVSGAKIDTSDHYSVGFSTVVDRRTLGTSDSDGNYRLESMAPGQMTFTAFAKGYAPGGATVDLAPGETKSGVDISLGEDMTVEGHVVGAGGKPVTAHINILHTGLPVQKTDESGHFKIGGLSPGDVTLIVISHNPQLMKQVTVKAGNKKLMIKMDTQVTIRGRVIDGTTRQPITDFKAPGAGEILTDGEGPGGFRFYLEPGQSTYLKISAEGYATKSFEVVAPKTGSETTKIFELGLPSGVSGRVLFADSKKPAPDVPIAAFETVQFSTTPAGNSVTDADGTFLIANIPSGKLRITAMPKPPMVAVDKEIEVEEGAFSDLGDILISESAAITGFVVSSPTGEGRAGVPVTARTNVRGQTLELTSQSGPDGSFKFSNVQPGHYTVTAQSTVQTILLASGETRELYFRLGSVTMRGTIFTSGEPEALVIIARNTIAGQSVHSFQPKNGSYVLPNLEPGPYEITFGGTINKLANTGLRMEQFTVPDQDQVYKDFDIP